MTAVTKKFSGAPFGTQKERFEHIGHHPVMNTAGVAYTYSKNRLGPGWYETGKSTLKRPSTGPGWHRQHETEKMAKIPHILYREQWVRNKEQVRAMGPGAYDHDKFFTDHMSPEFKRGMLSMYDARMGRQYPNMYPGPGVYGEGGVPDAAFTREKRFSRKGMMDAGARNRSMPLVGSHLPPGTYELKGFIDELKRRSSGKRGPYQIFNTQRSDYKTGHWAVKPCKLGPGQYEHTSFTDDWSGHALKYHGRFTAPDTVPHKVPCHERPYCDTLAVCPRNPDEPAPCAYDVIKPKPKPLQQEPAFKSTERRDNKLITIRINGGVHNPVGMGRYENHLKPDWYKNGFTSAFNGASRFSSAKSERASRDRKRFKIIELEQRQILRNAPQHVPIQSGTVES